MRLGISVTDNVPQHCQHCSQEMPDNRGYHYIDCRRAAGYRTKKHHAVNQTIAGICDSCSALVQLEPNGLYRSEDVNARPDALVAAGTFIAKYDISITNPLCTTSLSAAANQVMGAASLRYNTKKAHYQQLPEVSSIRGTNVLIFETTGAIHSAASAFFKRLSKALAMTCVDNYTESQIIKMLKANIAVDIAEGNAWSLRAGLSGKFKSFRKPPFHRFAIA